MAESRRFASWFDEKIAREFFQSATISRVFLDQLETMQTHKSVSDMASNKESFLNWFSFRKHSTKGQLISEQIYGVLNFQKMQRNIARIYALKVS